VSALCQVAARRSDMRNVCHARCLSCEVSVMRGVCHEVIDDAMAIATDANQCPQPQPPAFMAYTPQPVYAAPAPQPTMMMYPEVSMVRCCVLQLLVLVLVVHLFVRVLCISCMGLCCLVCGHDMSATLLTLCMSCSTRSKTSSHQDMPWRS
jgi:hypothetical protein